MARGERDWAQLESFEAEYAERLAAEARRPDSPFLAVLRKRAAGERLYSDEIKVRDEPTRRLFALRGKILSLREKLGEAIPGESAEVLLPVEAALVRPAEVPKKTPGRAPIEFVSDPVPPGHLYPVTYAEIKATLSELPPEHTASIWRVHLTNQKRTGTDGDWLDGEIRLHCLLAEDGRRQVGRNEGTQDIERWGGTLLWEGNKLWARWPLDVYKTFVLRRVLIHEVAHGVAELPGMREAVRSAGSLERFCELYAENFHRPPGKSVKLAF